MEKPPQHEELKTPREVEEKPELQLCWQGLSVSISGGFLTREEAMDILHGLEDDLEVTDGD